MLEILKYPDPKLKEVAREVDKFDKKLHHLLDQMAETMYGANGIGLAAPQVGESLRLFVIDLGPMEDQPAKLYEFINPVIESGDGKIVFEEGCLSVPGVTEEVVRKERVSVSYQDRNGESHRMVAEGLLAVAIQHENDHLDGTLFIEKLSALKRRLLKKKLERAVTL